MFGILRLRDLAYSWSGAAWAEEKGGRWQRDVLIAERRCRTFPTISAPDARPYLECAADYELCDAPDAIIEVEPPTEPVAIAGTQRGTLESMTDEVALRDVRESDLPVFFEQQSDPEATRVAAFPCRAHAEFMAHWAKILAGEAVLVKTIIFRGNVAGNIVAWEQSGELKIGYWLGREYWGKGIATAALSEFLLQAKVRPLYARVAKHNRASIRVLQKCGFTVAGEDKFRDINGGESEEFIFKLEADRGYEPDATADQPRE